VDVIAQMDAVLNDSELLARFAASGAQADLSPLVYRYVDLVYSAALRQVRDGHGAQDVVQQVFIILLRKGRSLRPDTILPAWLLKVTALECRNYLRTQARRARRERKAAEMTFEARREQERSAMSQAGEPGWEELSPHIDAALATLSEGDREAVVMRFFMNHSYGEAAALLGASEGSVRQRVHRGLGKMREILQARGVIATEAALSTALIAHAVTSAPASVSAATVAAISHAAIAKAAVSKGVFTIMSAASPAKIVAIVVIVLMAVSLTAFLMTPGNRAGGASGGGPLVTDKPATAPASMPAAPVASAIAPAAPAAAPDPLPPAPAVPRKLFDVITARTCNARQGPRDGFDHLSFINRGDWVEYDGVEFPPADQPRLLAFRAVVACPAIYAGNDIEVHIGAPDGPKIATLTVEATEGYGDFVCQQTLTESAPGGKQDVFLVFSGGGFNLRSIKFAVVDGRKADKQIAATGYVMAKRVNEGAQALVQVRDGAWARYDCLEFPAEGVDTITLNYAVDAAHAGGVISVRLGLPTAPAICEIPIVSTGGYQSFFTRAVALKELVKGKHDVFVTFSGTNRGYFGLADLAWFKFNAKGTAAPTGPPPPPATRPIRIAPAPLPAATQPFDRF